MKQTSVDWLREKLWKEFNFSFSDNILEQAKEMEKHDELKLNKILKNLQDSNYLPGMDDDTRDTLISLIKETPKKLQ